MIMSTPNKALALLDKAVLASFDKEKIPSLMALPHPTLDSIKAAFTTPFSSMTTKDSTTSLSLPLIPQTGTTKTHTHERARFDKRFQLGYSRQSGHTVELSSDKDGSLGIERIDSGTFVLERNESPYASVLDDQWRGRLCEECYRVLPSDQSSLFYCPGCNTEEQQDQDKNTSTTTDPAQGSTTFCSRQCLQEAWRAWHGYECGHRLDVASWSLKTRLALRVYWRNAQSLLKMAPPIQRTLSRKVSTPSFSQCSPISPSPSDVASLVDATEALSLENERRIVIEDGSMIHPNQLCTNFAKLDHSHRTAYLMTGYFLQRYFDLPEDAAMELAYIQALVQFNVFAIKSQMEEPVPESEESAIQNKEDRTIGSGLYLLGSMFNHSCAPNAMAVFGINTKAPKRTLGSNALAQDPRGADPRWLNILTTKTLRNTCHPPVAIEISYGPQGSRMPTEQRKEILKQNYAFDCNCSACNDRYAVVIRQKIYKCPVNGYSCRPMSMDDLSCPTCGAKIDMDLRSKTAGAMVRLMEELEGPSLTLKKRLQLLQSLEVYQSETFINTCIYYGNTCDQLARLFAEMGDLGQSIEWCKMAFKVVTVHFPHDSIEVAQETLKLAGLLFNNSQPKEALKYVKKGIVLFKGHYGPESQNPDLLELLEMEKVLVPVVTSMK